MPVKYVNRRGQTYYLHKGKTKTGKPKYFFSLKTEGTLADKIPDGFEIYENPDAQVFLRRTLPKIITDAEKSVVEKGMKEFAKCKYSVVDIKGNTITVFIANQDVDEFSEIFKFSPMKHTKPDIDTVFNQIVSYSPKMQFVLVDKDKRLFITKRFCYLGSVDDWIEISGPDTLENLVKKYVKHIDKDSYYELF